MSIEIPKKKNCYCKFLGLDNGIVNISYLESPYIVYVVVYVVTRMIKCSGTMNGAEPYWINSPIIRR